MKSVIAVQFRRKLSGRTDYRKRLSLLKSGTPRLIVRKTLSSIILQVAEFDQSGDRILLAITSRKLKSFGWTHSCKNIPAAYLSGLLLGKRASAMKISAVVPDIGLHSITKGGKIFAAIKGAKDGGLALEVSDDVVPVDALSGSKVAANVKSAASIASDFEKVKMAIEKEK